MRRLHLVEAEAAKNPTLVKALSIVVTGDSSVRDRIIRNVRRWILPALAVSLLLTALASSPSPGAASGSTSGRHRYIATGDVAARELARTAQTLAETLATEHNGTYTDVSLTTLHKLEQFMPISPREAHRQHEGAYLLSASGTKNSYVLTTHSQNGDMYTIRHASNGTITRYAYVCGKRRNWCRRNSGRSPTSTT
jgi:hypothetical protein